MIVNAHLVLVLVALLLTVASAMGKVPIWPAVVLLCCALLIRGFGA
jgi:hypothetical protein